MAFSIYKSGQGYWTRMLTAVGAGVLVLAGVAWLWNLLGSLGNNSQAEAPASAVAASLAEWGREHNNADLASVRGIGRVERSPGDANTVTVTTNDTPARNIPVSFATFTEAFQRAQKRTSPDVTPAPIVQPDVIDVANLGNTVQVSQADFVARNRLYLQAAAAVLLIVGFGLLLFYLLNKPRIVDFMIATEAEMRKVSWPSRREIIGSTWVVIAGTAMLAVLLLLIDLGFTWFFTRIGVLDVGI
jgi:preprotein translocase SecE subunit